MLCKYKQTYDTYFLNIFSRKIILHLEYIYGEWDFDIT